MTAVQLMLEGEKKMSLRKALRYSGMSSCSYYYKPALRRVFEPDPTIVQKVEEISLQRPFYGTRRMAAQLSRELRVPINRKRVQKVFHKLNWIEPAKTKSEVIRSAVSKVVRASRPYEFWQTDMTYLWCGNRDRWSYLFNVIDVFHREWLGYAFERSAVKEHAIMSVNNALASHMEADPDELTLRCDNGPQYTSHAFKDSMDALGLRLEYILYHTPEQNGFVESFHKTLKREYVWPREFSSHQDAEVVIEEAFTDYNKNRIHSALDYMTPYEYLDAWRNGRISSTQTKVSN
jgi:putative transposase